MSALLHACQHRLVQAGICDTRCGARKQARKPAGKVQQRTRVVSSRICWDSGNAQWEWAAVRIWGSVTVGGAGRGDADGTWSGPDPGGDILGLVDSDAASWDSDGVSALDAEAGAEAEAGSDGDPLGMDVDSGALDWGGTGDVEEGLSSVVDIPAVVVVVDDSSVVVSGCSVVVVSACDVVSPCVVVVDSSAVVRSVVDVSWSVVVETAVVISRVTWVVVVTTSVLMLARGDLDPRMPGNHAC
jgi:hypothetical protein